jgi:hypothetical protein
MANDAYSAAEARWLQESDDQCDRCGEPTDGSALCWRHADEQYEAELQATEGNERTRS